MSKTKVSTYKMSNSRKINERIEQGLRDLQLDGMLPVYDMLAKDNINNHDSPYVFLERLLEKQINWKEDLRIRNRILQAKFPYVKTIKDFDFSFQPSIDEQKIKTLATGKFINDKQNVIFLGPAGVGKTHLSISLGISAIYEGHDVKFLTIDKLIELIEKASRGESYEIPRLSASLLRPEVLILDEMDFYETSRLVSQFIFRLLHRRCEIGSTMFTSNKSFTSWNEIFGSETRAMSIIDRIVERGVVINIQGDSYRVKDKINKVKN